MSRAPKPRLAAGKITITAENGGPGLGTQAPVLVTGERKEALPLRLSRNLVGTLLLAGLLVSLLYTALAATLIAALPAGDDRVLVTRGAFPGGIPAAGSFAYVSGAPADKTPLGKLKEAYLDVPAGAVVEIVTGPSGQVATNPDGQIVHDDEPTGYTGQVNALHLIRQYVAICVTGACEPGQAVLIPQDHIIGEAKGTIGFDGLTEFASTGGNE